MSNKTPHFFVLEIPKREDRCPNAVYFVKTSSGVSMYVTNINNKVYPVANGNPSSISSLVSPEGTISVEINGDITEIDISQSILDELDAIRNAIVQPPNYIQPSANISFGNPTVVEAGTNLSRIVTATFTQNDAGEVNNIKILRDSNILVNQNTNQTTLSIGDNFIIGRETVTHTCQISFDTGIIKQNNLGIEDPTGRIQAGIKTSNKNIVGRLKIFYGSRDKFYNTGQEIRDAFNVPGSFTFETSNSFTFDANNKFHTIAIPTTVNINNIDIKTSSFETITQDFLNSEQIIAIPDAELPNGNLTNYRVLTYETDNNYNVEIQVNL